MNSVFFDPAISDDERRDYLRVSDLTHIPEDVCRSYDGGTPLVDFRRTEEILAGVA